MVKRFISTLVLVVALVGSVSAQSLDDLSKKVYDLSFEIINKGMNAYEEQLEKQELEEVKKALEETKKTLEEVKKIEEETKKIEEETKKIEEERKAEEEVEESNFEENRNILYDVAIRYPLEHNVWIKCYCPPVGDYIWYIIFYGDDNDWWINLAYNNNGEIGDVFYVTKNKSLAYLKFKDDISGKEIAAIRLDYIIVLQDAHEPRAFTINW